MDEAMRCDRVALIQDGKILSIDAPAKDKGRIQQKTLHCKICPEKYKLIKCTKENILRY